MAESAESHILTSFAQNFKVRYVEGAGSGGSEYEITPTNITILEDHLKCPVIRQTEHIAFKDLTEISINHFAAFGLEVYATRSFGIKCNGETFNFLTMGKEERIQILWAILKRYGINDITKAHLSTIRSAKEPTYLSLEWVEPEEEEKEDIVPDAIVEVDLNITKVIQPTEHQQHHLQKHKDDAANLMKERENLDVLRKELEDKEAKCQKSMEDAQREKDEYLQNKAAFKRKQEQLKDAMSKLDADRLELENEKKEKLTVDAEGEALLQIERERLEQCQKDLEREKAEIDTERKQWKEQRDHFEDQQKGAEDAQNTLDRLIEHNQKIKMELEDEIETKREKLRNDAADLETKRKTLQNEAADLETKRETLRNEAAGLETKRETLRTHAEDLESEQEKLRNDAADLETKRETLRVDAEELDSLRTEQQNEMERHSQILEQRASQLTQLEESRSSDPDNADHDSDDIGTLRKELESEREFRKKLEGRNEILQKKQREWKAYRRQLKEQIGKLEDQIKQLHGVHADNMRLKVTLKFRKNAWAKEREKMQICITKLQSYCQESKSIIFKMQGDAMQMESENSRLLSELRSCEGMKEMMTTELSTERETVRELAIKMQNDEKQFGNDVKSLKEKISDLEMEKMKITESLLKSWKLNRENMHSVVHSQDALRACKVPVSRQQHDGIRFIRNEYKKKKVWPNLKRVE